MDDIRLEFDTLPNEALTRFISENIFNVGVTQGKRLGTRQMDAAEGMATERGATGVNLEAFSVRALGFYQHRGYKVFGQIDDWPPGHAKYYLRKNLG